MDRKELQDGVNRLMSNMPEGTTSGSFSWKKGSHNFNVSYSDTGNGNANISISDSAPAGSNTDSNSGLVDPNTSAAAQTSVNA